MKYVEKYLSVDCIEGYYTCFSSSFLKKILALFRQAIDRYAQNTGRDIYERIVKLFGKMIKINGRKVVVEQMTAQYRVGYRNRKAAIEVTNPHQ